MEPSYRLRLYLLTALVLVGLGALLSRLHEFQIVRRDEFLQLVPGNRNVTIREPGIRGEITDRNGIMLAHNLRNYEVSFNLEEIKEAYKAQREDPRLNRLTKRKGLLRKESEADIVTMVTDGPIRILADPQLNLARPYKASDLRTHYITHGGLIPFSYRADLSYEEFSKFAEHNLDLPGVYLSLRPKREYPYGSLASHVLGYLKQWDKGDVPESDMRKFDHYIGDEKGIAGIESSMDAILRGPEGQKTIIKDAKGHTIRMADYTKPGIGAKLELTLDARVQFLLENSLRFAGRAAGVVMDINTGEVLAMASVPDYNPNNFIPSITQKNWDEYRTNPLLTPLTNRTISAFVPGSTMKVPTAIAGALSGQASRQFSCDGTVTYGNHSIGCWIWNQHKGSHGSQNLSQAIQHSCNPYFNKLANTIGWKAMVEGCQLAGIGKRTGIELPEEKAGSLPGSRAWRTANPTAAMTPHETAQLSIGQGTSLATPLQMCAVAAAVGNGGKYYQPRIVKQAIAENGKILIPDEPKLEVDFIKAGIKPADLELIRRGMFMSTNLPGGTTGKVKLPNIEISCKSGTAQVMENGKKSNNSWVMSFAPYQNPKYAVCILVQNGSAGGAVCGPLVNLVYRGLFARDYKGIRLPLKPQTRAPGFVGEIVKSIEIPRETLLATEAGDTEPAPDAITDTLPASIEGDEGETGDEATDIVAPTEISPAPATVPVTPTITPEVDAEGAVPPKSTAPKDLPLSPTSPDEN